MARTATVGRRPGRAPAVAAVLAVAAVALGACSPSPADVASADDVAACLRASEADPDTLFTGERDGIRDRLGRYDVVSCLVATTSDADRGAVLGAAFDERAPDAAWEQSGDERHEWLVEVVATSQPLVDPDIVALRLGQVLRGFDELDGSDPSDDTTAGRNRGQARLLALRLHQAAFGGPDLSDVLAGQADRELDATMAWYANQSAVDAEFGDEVAVMEQWADTIDATRSAQG